MSDAAMQYGTSESFSATAAAGSLHEDLKVAYWILVTSARGEEVRAIETEALIRSLYVTLHGQAEPTLPQFDVPLPEIYAVAHAVNVALVTMAVAEHMGFDEEGTRRLGTAALLKDIGQGRVPPDLLGKTTPLTPPELERMRRHPADGARMLIRTDEPLELAAVVAYEHHLGLAGQGYPDLANPRRTHLASRLIRIVDVFCALHVRRPHRDAWDIDEVLTHIAERAGVEFDRELTRSFIDAMSSLKSRIVRLTTPEAKLPWG